MRQSRAMSDAAEPASKDRRRLIAAGAAAAIGASVLGSAISPYLLTHAPVALLALAPEPRHVVLTTPLLPGALVVSVAVARRVLGLLALFLFGRAYGEGAIHFIERHVGALGKMMRWIQRHLTRWGTVIVLVLPMPSVCVLAGVANAKLPRTVLAMTVGQLFWVTLTWALGDVLEPWTRVVVDFVGAHVLEATAVAVVVVVVWQLRRYLRAEKVDDPPEE